LNWLLVVACAAAAAGLGYYFAEHINQHQDAPDAQSLMVVPEMMIAESSMPGSAQP
jgi:hypothetical protein